MIWRIVRKDWSLLWPLVAIVTAVQFANAAAWFELGHFQEPQGLVIVAQVLSYAVLLGLVVLITATVQQDVLPGVSQDWLVRPIRRSALIGAKLLFVLATIHGPMLLADIAHGTGLGFTFGDNVKVALARTVYMALVFDLPVLALAALTRSLVQVGVAMLALWFTVAAGVALSIGVRGGAPPPFAASGMQWMTPTYWSLLAIAAACVILPLQYSRRQTARSRRVLYATVVLAPVLSFSTWAAAFSFQQSLSQDPVLAQPIAISFDPKLGRAEPGAGAALTSGVLLPVRVVGIPPDSIVMNDRAQVRLLRANGTFLYSARSIAGVGYSDDFPAGTKQGGEVRLHQRIVFPEKVYALIRSQSVRMEIDYSLTLFHVAAAHSVAAVKGDGRSAAFGWCRSTLDEEGDDIEVGCVKAGSFPKCVTITLENPANGKRNPDIPHCQPDYSPLHIQFHPDAISHFGAEIKFQDAQHLATFPVDGSQVADARLLLKSYEPVAHFTRRLVIPDVRLGEWSAVSTVNQQY